MDANLNAALYTGSVTGEWTLEERDYAEDIRPTDQQDYRDPSNSTEDASGYEYVRMTTTGGATPPKSNPMSAPSPGAHRDGTFDQAPQY